MTTRRTFRDRLRRADRGLLILLALLLLTAPVIQRRIYASDEIKYLAYPQSLVFDHDLDFTNQYQGWFDRDPRKYAFIPDLLKTEPLTGRPINEAPIGTGLLWLPFFLIGHVVALAARALGANVAADGYSTPYVWAVCYASFLYGWAGLLLIYRLLRKWTEPFIAAGAVITTWLATSAFHYMVAAPPWSHAASLFAVALFVTVWYETRGVRQRTPVQWLVLGGTAGLMMLVREQDALFLVIPAVETGLWGLRVGGWGLVTRGRGSGVRDQGSAGGGEATTLPERVGQVPRIALGWGLMLGAAVVVFVPQLIAYHAINGTWGPSKTVASKLTWWSPHFFEVLFSPQYGLVMWAPVIALALIGLVVLGRRDPTLAVAFGVAVLAQVFVAGAFLTWKGASSFGQRRFINATVIIAFGLAAGAEALRTRGVPRWSLAGVAALFIAWNLGLELQYATVWTSAQREAGLPALLDLLGQQVGLIGRLPGTLAKILTNPGTFQNPEGRP